MLPILLSLGPIKIYSYGLFIALAFLSATFLTWKLAREEEIDEEKILDLILLTVFNGIIGSRIFYVLLNYEIFRPDVIRIIHLSKYPGLAFYGGLILGLATAIYFLIKNKLPFWKIADIIVIPLCLSQAIGRIGCFLNGCCLGKITNLPWGMYFLGVSGKRHPTQIYEAISDLLIFFLIFSIYKKTINLKNEKRGYVMLTYFILSNLSRFILEFLRDNSVYWHRFSVSQWSSVIFFIGSLAVFIYRYHLEIKSFLTKFNLKIKNK